MAYVRRGPSAKVVKEVVAKVLGTPPTNPVVEVKRAFDSRNQIAQNTRSISPSGEAGCNERVGRG
ncbi:MAG: hypothetical protein QW780_03350 [Sulfolobales archaeon]